MRRTNLRGSQLDLSGLISLLGEIMSTPSLFVDDHDLAIALKSQGGLAKYTNPGRAVCGASLNTQRKYADRSIEGGFAALDSARKAAADVLFQFKSDTAKPATSTKAGLLAKAEALKEDVHRLEEDLEILSDLLERSLRHARAYAASADQATRDRCRKEQAEILLLLGPRSKPRLKVVA